MLVTSLVVGFFLGGLGVGVWGTRRGYTAKLNAIAAEVRDAERSIVGETRTLAARIKAFL